MRLWLVLSVLAVTTTAHAKRLQMAAEPMGARLQIVGESGDPMPLIEERLRVTIDGQYATSKLKQVYENRNGRRVEGQYKLRAGSGTHVDGFTYWNGEEKIIGEVFEKNDAREVYQRVTSRNRDPGLLEQEGEGVFSFKIFPIEPSEKKRVEMQFSRWLTRRNSTVEFAAPISSAQANIEVRLGHPAGINNIRSRTHNIAMENLPNGGVRIRANGFKGKPSDKFVLSYDVTDKPWAANAFVHQSGGHDGYFALSLAAPKLPANQVAAKDVTLVLDRSGSMAGDNLTNAVAAAKNVVARLDNNDRVNVITFDDDVDMLYTQPRPVADVRAEAMGYISGITDGGGTDIALALQQALKAQANSNRPRVVLFLTDGQSDSQAALQMAKADKQDVRVFTIGLGDGVEKPLLSRLAAMKRGRFTFIEDAKSIERTVGRLYATIAAPVMVGVSLSIDGGTPMRVYPRSLPDLFANDELLITGRIRNNGNAPVSFTLHGLVNGKQAAITTVARASSRPWIGRLWAQSRVEHLEEEIALHGENQEVRDEVIDLSLAYNFVTKYTAFLAIPESEVAVAGDALVRARAKRQAALARKIDAAELEKKADKGGLAVGGAMPSGTMTAKSKRAAMPRKAPAPPPPMDFKAAEEAAEPTPDFADDAVDGDMAAAPKDETAQQFAQEPGAADNDARRSQVQSTEGGETQGSSAPGTVPQPAKVDKKGGCAGCQSSQGLPSGAALLLSMLGLFLVTRRRRYS